MLYHVRFFKVPRVVTRNGKTEINAVGTITNDLGDVTFFGDVDLRVKVGDVTRVLKWKSGVRSIELKVEIAARKLGLHRLYVCAVEGSATDPLNEQPEFLGVASEVFSSSIECEKYAIRSFPELEILEETGNHIERHLWDAGISTCRFLYDDGAVALRESPKRVLELGTGCGLVGLTLKVIYPDANVVLTDLGEARDICERNISRNSSKCSFQEFDWDDLVSAPKGHWDLVAVTDCTYNPSAYPALLNALKAVTRAGTQILLAHKYRDSSEGEFFTLFCESPLYKVEQDTRLNYFSQPVRVIIARRR